MSTQWNSIYIRDAFGDTGLSPSGVATASQSPDVIPYGVLPMQNFPQQLVDTWAQDIGVDVVLAQPNYLYVRGMNSVTDTGPASGRFELYYAPSGTILQPSTFVSIPAYDGTQVSVGPTDAGVVATPNQAFYWQNPTAPPADQHYCLIATFQSNTIPNPVPATDFSSIDAYIAWVVNNPNVAWRNITTVPSATTAFTTSINIANPDSLNQNYLLVAECSNIPAGTTVTMSCAAQGPSPAIYVQVVSSTPSFGVATPITSLPASWGPAPLVVTLQAASGQVLDGASATIRQLLMSGDSTSPTIRRLMRPLHRYSRHPILNQDRSVQETSVTRCGEFSIYFQTATGFRVPLRSIDS